jgi:chemotaxis protein methyltransferase CheR
MRPDIDLPILERFRAGITARMGLAFDDNRASSLVEVLNERAQATHVTPERYVDQLASATAELPELARRLTVPETYFFRNQAQLDACMERAVPACLERRKSLRILSAACASGEEPYSLAILLRERWPAFAPHITILGADLNPTMLQRARSGRYSAWSLRETPAAWKERYFERLGSDYDLSGAIRSSVTFESLNLVEPEPTQLLDSTYDIVFCRNALMYFTPDHFAQAVGRLARALLPGGFFFLGHAETLRGVSQDFHLCHAGDAFYYQRREGPLRTSYPAPDYAHRHRPMPTKVGVATRVPDEAPAEDREWYDAITRSTDRVNALHDCAPLRGALPDETRAKPHHSQLLDLLEKEQFADALTLLQNVEAPGEDSDHAMLRALVATQAGRFDVARELCQRILQRDELNAGAQYVLALCHEHAGEADRAIYHDQLSAYLDPGFAMPRVHLGLLYKRRGDALAANRELREARRLIEREDSARLLLFGGGFGRAALLALCDAELSTTPREAR